MKMLTSKLIVVFLSISSITLMAATVDDGPPEQQQKNQVPDSTRNGNYLENQPDNNGANDSTTKSNKKSDKGMNIEKSKKVKEPPENGGVNVN